jgi:hypothetical protein
MNYSMKDPGFSSRSGRLAIGTPPPERAPVIMKKLWVKPLWRDRLGLGDRVGLRAEGLVMLFSY